MRPFISLIWSHEGDRSDLSASELALPTGAMHLVVRLSDAPVQAWDRDGRFDIANMVVGGVRDAPYRKQLRGGPGVGAMLRPGASASLFGAPGAALAQRHIGLADLWGADACAPLHDRLAGAAPTERLNIFEAELVRRLRDAAAPDPFVTHAARALRHGVGVGQIVMRAECSHRHFVARFVDAIGVTPKTYQRLARFNRVLDQIHRRPSLSLAEAAAAHGYADQSHLTRDFSSFAELTPNRFRRIGPAQARHVPLGGSDLFKTG